MWGKNDKNFYKKKYIFNPQNKGYKIRISPALEKSDGFYNVALAIRKKKVGPPISIISFIDNDILIWLKDTKLNKYIPVASGIIPHTSKNLDVEYILKEDSTCLILVNRIIVTASNKCISYPHYIKAI